MFCHEKLKVYQLSVQFLGTAIVVLRSLPPGNADIANQLRRAAILDLLSAWELSPAEALVNPRKLLDEIAAMSGALSLRN